MIKPIIHKGQTYKTRSNRRVLVKTKGGNYINRRIEKYAKVHRCHGCNQKLTSIPRLRYSAFSKLSITKKRVSRPYGATMCGKCVCSKVLMGFFSSEEELSKVKVTQE